MSNIEKMYRPKKGNVEKMNAYYEKLKKQGVIRDEPSNDTRGGGISDNGHSNI